jgi:hypothetical protein
MELFLTHIEHNLWWCGMSTSTNPRQYHTLRIKPQVHAWLIRLARKWQLTYGGQPSAGKALERLCRWTELGIQDERRK